MVFVLILNQSEAQPAHELKDYKNSLLSEKSQLLITAEGLPHVVSPKFVFTPGVIGKLESSSEKLLHTVKPNKYLEMVSKASSTLITETKKIKGKNGVIFVVVCAAGGAIIDSMTE